MYMIFIPAGFAWNICGTDGGLGISLINGGGVKEVTFTVSLSVLAPPTAPSFSNASFLLMSNHWLSPDKMIKIIDYLLNMINLFLHIPSSWMDDDDDEDEENEDEELLAVWFFLNPSLTRT